MASLRERIEMERREGAQNCLCYILAIVIYLPVVSTEEKIQPPAYSAFGMELNRDFMSGDENESATFSSGEEETSTNEKYIHCSLSC